MDRKKVFFPNEKEYFFLVLVHSLWCEPSTVHIQPVHWFHIIWSLGAFQFMCKLRGMQCTVLMWRSGNHIKDSWRPCLRIVWNHEPKWDVSENMSYFLDLCVRNGKEIPVEHFIHAMFPSGLILVAVALYCSWVSLFSLWVFHQELFSWLKCALIFLVNFVQVYNARGGILCWSIRWVDCW